MWVNHWVVFPRMNDLPCFAVLTVDRCSVFYTCFVCVCVCVIVLVEGKKWNERACRYKSNLLAVVVSSSKNQLWISANKVTKLEEWLLTPPVYSLRRTHAYDELPFAETSRAEQVLQTVTVCFGSLQICHYCVIKNFAHIISHNPHSLETRCLLADLVELRKQHTQWQKVSHCSLFNITT
jgi:hypothetical protein